LAGTLESSVTGALAPIFQEHADQLGADLRVAIDLELEAATHTDAALDAQSETQNEET
jgi:hypothetical protein